ncbi:c-type cytochrome [Flavobacteriaceae bacterium 14752]|uniref:c-type cytochrome n=1 Tax=Mesohalobacter salilacus TaxID=2491711 RepID=UPI000F62DFFB|nr:c-type cytochrome [Flavobacteriaceae bacterium 14752]
MKKVILRPSLFALFFILFSICAYSQDAKTDSTATASAENTEAASSVVPGGDPAKGEKLFKSLCAACHKPYERAVGPALHGVVNKYDGDFEWLYAWIKNSQKLIKSGDSRAVAIYEEYNQTAMNAFPQLSNQDIDNILAYVEQPKPEPKVAVADNAAVGGQAQGNQISTDLILAILSFVLLLLVVILYLVNKTLNRFAEVNGVQLKSEDGQPRKPLWKAYAENGFLVLVTAVIFLLGTAWFGYGYLMQVGVDQGYEPIQPIHYSHRIHAGENKIDCKYCHSSARVSKHSGIPSLNVCMNCHKQIAEVAPETQAKGKEEFNVDYNAEIVKLYEAVGWDKTTQSYTGETKPVKWVRLHNLPDLAYFNHSQHVTVGQIECQTCHGPVEEMEVMYQHAPLTMGWCINCHRETNVKVKDNGYYTKIHEELSKKYNVEEFTAADMGGIECGKCHY